MLFRSPDLPTLIAYLFTLVVAFTIHEFAHAWTANQLGDRTAAYQGRLSLNPAVHIDPFGALMLLIAGFGWARPVPVNPYNLRYGKLGWVMVAAAGPLSNLLLAMLAAIPFRLDLINEFDVARGLLPSLGYLLDVFIDINLVLMVFNLLPIAPLDGFRIAVGLLPDSISYSLQRLEPYGPLILLLLFVAGRSILGALIGGPIDTLRDLILSS
jgi:Zn-dependent protease